MLKFYGEAMNYTDEQVISKVGNGFTSQRPDDYRATAKRHFDQLNTIAYL